MSDPADELRKHLNQVINILQPYALSSGSIKSSRPTQLSMVYLQWADRAIEKLP